MASLAIEPFDVRSAPEAEVRELWELDVAVEREHTPDELLAPFEVALSWYRHRAPHRHVWRWLARENDRLVGEAGYRWSDVPANRDHAGLWVQVHPDHRRRGLGGRLTAIAAGAAVEFGCRIVGASAFVGGPGEPFLERLGAQRKMVEPRNICRVADIDRSRLETWVARAEERAAAYSLVTWDGPCPAELVDAYVELFHVMNTAPREDLEMEDDVFSVELLRAQEAMWEPRGETCWTACARHDPSGELAGFSQLGFHRDWPQHGSQGDTGVWPKHRDRGLGRWVKAVNALRMLDERPEVTFIETWNAHSNEPMLKLNEEMGFRPLGYWGEWQVPADRLLEEARASAT